MDLSTVPVWVWVVLAVVALLVLPLKLRVLSKLFGRPAPPPEDE